MDCIVYPCSNDIMPFIECVNSMEDELRITKAVCTEICKRTIHDTYSCEIVTDFDAALNEVECAIIYDYVNIIYMYDDIIEKLTLALERGKCVLCYAALNPDDLESLKNLAEDHDTEFVYFGEIKLPEITERTYEKQECVVVGIGKLFDGINSDVIFCQIFKKFKAEGYNVIGISTSKNAEIMGCYTLPSSIFASVADESEKVLFLNSYICDIELRHCPDIILLQFPGGMSMLSEDMGEDFNIRSYTLSRAVSVDYFVLAIPVYVSAPENLTEYSIEYRYKYGFNIDAFAISNSEIDLNVTFVSNKVELQSTPDKDIESYQDECIEKCDKFIFCNVHSDDDYDMLVQNCIETLSGNIEVI